MTGYKERRLIQDDSGPILWLVKHMLGKDPCNWAVGCCLIRVCRLLHNRLFFHVASLPGTKETRP